MNEALIADIKKIIEDLSLTRPEKSREIMFRLRKEFIYVKNSYINIFRTSDSVTIDPFSEDVKAELEEGEREGLQGNEYTKIYAYSFGPWKPEYYFQEGIFKIVWLLREPLLDEIGQMRGRLEGVNQADDFRTMAEVKVDESNGGTKTNIIKFVQRLLKDIAAISENELHKIKDESLRKQIECLQKENLDDEDVVMSHICILEINHFPGLNLGKQTFSDENRISWAKGNEELLEVLINFYSDIIILGDYQSLSSLTSYNYKELNWDDKKKEPGSWSLEHFFYWLENHCHADCYPELQITLCKRKMTKKIISPHRQVSNRRKPTAILDNHNCFWIAYYHPSFYSLAGNTALEIFSKWVRTTIISYYQ